MVIRGGEDFEPGVGADAVVERSGLLGSRQVVGAAGEDQDGNVGGDLVDGPEGRNLVELGKDDEGREPKAQVREPIQGRGEVRPGSVPHGCFQVLVGALKNVPLNAVAKLAGGEGRGGRAQRDAKDDHRLARSPKPEEIDRRDHVAPGAVADVVAVAGRVAVRPERDQKDPAAGFGRQDLRAPEAMGATPLVPVQEQHGGAVAPLGEPGADLLAIIGGEPVFLQRSPDDPRRRLRERRPVAMREPISNRRRHEQPARRQNPDGDQPAPGSRPREESAVRSRHWVPVAFGEGQNCSRPL